MPAHPEHLLWWVSQLRHTTGRWAGQPFDPRPWQVDLIRDLFALRPDGRRQHREGLIGVGRKAGKTTLTAGLALGLLVLEAQPGATIVGAAAKRDQAGLMLEEAKRLVRRSSIGGVPLDADKGGWLKISRNAIFFPELDAVYKTVSADAELEQGLNPNVVIMDELHVQPSPDLYEALSTAQGAWEDPLLISITTAGARKSGICWDRYQAGLRGDDAEFFFRWWEAAAGCDLDDPAAWAQANPGYPDVPSPSYLTGQLNRTTEGAFRRLHLNQWTQAIERWLPAPDWNATCGEPDIPEGSEVVITADAALRRDTFAVVIARVDEHGNPHARVKVFKAPEGSRIDFQEVETYLLAAAMRYQVRTFGGDPAFMTLLAQRLEERGLPWTPYPQSDERMLMASELLQRVVLDRTLRRGADPEWDEQMAGTQVREMDRGVRISKGKSGGRNDAVIALAMAMALLFGDQESEKEHYFTVLGG